MRRTSIFTERESARRPRDQNFPHDEGDRSSLDCSPFAVLIVHGAWKWSYNMIKRSVFTGWFCSIIISSLTSKS
ncbi:hypothetical protein N7455_001843 [Penicillium solitum]|uniref:uncharacterized protein n=1 Tax=Penicillium solitum TaxID=60172 RepID=UPI0032C3F260|nr:hypothetical protein N7455_001843 [Penicillium solitum]